MLSVTPGDRRFAITDTSVAIVLERRETVRRRGRRPLAELAGYGSASRVRPGGVSWDLDGDASARAVTQALRDAGAAPGDITRLWPAAAGLEPADRGEQAGLGRAFGGRLPALRTPKVVLGEPVGPGGALSAALAVDELAGDPHGGAALVHATSLGGTAMSLVLRPCPDDNQRGI